MAAPPHLNIVTKARLVIKAIADDVDYVRALIEDNGAPKIPAALLCSFIQAAGRSPLDALRQAGVADDLPAALAWWRTHLGDFSRVDQGLVNHHPRAMVGADAVEPLRVATRWQPLFVGSVAVMSLHPTHAARIVAQTEAGVPLASLHNPLLYAGLTTLCMSAESDTFGATRQVIDGVLAYAGDGYMRLEHLHLDCTLVGLREGRLNLDWAIDPPPLRSLTVLFRDVWGVTVRAASPPAHIKLVGVHAAFLGQGVEAKTLYLEKVTVDADDEDEILQVNGTLRADRVELVGVRFELLAVAAEYVYLSDVDGGDLVTEELSCRILKGEDVNCRVRTAQDAVNRAGANGARPKIFRYLELAGPEDDNEDPPQLHAPAEDAEGNLVVCPGIPLNVLSPGKSIYIQGRIPPFLPGCDFTQVYIELDRIPRGEFERFEVMAVIADIAARWPLTLILRQKSMSLLDVFDEMFKARLANFVDELGGVVLGRGGRNPLSVEIID